MNEPSERPQPLEIPLSAIERETLLVLIEEFVLREGTDYGASEVPLERKIQQVLAQMEKGEVKLFFEPETESVTLVAAGVNDHDHSIQARPHD